MGASERTMEKTIFLFERHPDRSKPDFDRHYIENHAPLGTRLTRCLRGYSVNLVDGEGGPDAVTEHWLDNATDLLTPEIAYATREDFEAVVADDRSLFSGSTLYVVDAETYPVDNGALVSPLGQQSPGVKLFWFYRDAASAPPPPSGACRVVDNKVAYRLVFEDGTRKRVPAEFGLIRMAWALEAQNVEGAESALKTREFRFVPAPHWPGA